LEHLKLVLAFPVYMVCDKNSKSFKYYKLEKISQGFSGCCGELGFEDCTGKLSRFQLPMGFTESEDGNAPNGIAALE
jgi:hypothetical protein